ncbi:RNA-dependent RNA polymerase [Armillaria borealis mycovirgavirus 1]|nr:RNA-dependent RNA polymerase [Armillaria borealis mycovirgavirus 1]
MSFSNQLLESSSLSNLVNDAALANKQGAFVNEVERQLSDSFEQQSLYNTARTKYTLYCTLSAKEKETVSNAYPNFEITYRPSPINNHGVANGLRTLEQIHFLRSFSRDIPIAEIGGNPVPYAATGATNVISYKPIRDARDGARLTRQLEQVNKICGAKLRSKTTSSTMLSAANRWVHNTDHFIRPIPAEEDNLHCPQALFLHSMYDISLSTLSKILLCHKVKRALGVIVFDPLLLIAQKTNLTRGSIDVLNANWELIGSGVNTTVRFFFKDDESLNYEHNLADYLAFCTISHIDAGNHRYIIERVFNTGRITFEIVRVFGGLNTSAKLNFKYWFRHNSERVLIPILRYTNQAMKAKLGNYKRSVVCVDREFVNRVLSYGHTLKDDRTPQNLFTYMRTIDTRTTIDGVNVTTKTSLDYEVSSALSVVFWYRLYLETYGISKIVGSLKTHSTAVRNVASRSFFTLLRDRLILECSPLIGNEDFDITSVFQKISSLFKKSYMNRVDDKTPNANLSNIHQDLFIDIDDTCEAQITEMQVALDNCEGHEMWESITKEVFSRDVDAIKKQLDAAALIVRTSAKDSDAHAKALGTIRLLERQLFLLDSTYVMGSAWSTDELKERDLDRIAPLVGSQDHGEQYAPPSVTEGGFQTMPEAVPSIAGDGNCGYHCLAVFTGLAVDTLRQQAADNIGSVPNWVFGFSSTNATETAKNALAGKGVLNITTAMYANAAALCSCAKANKIGLTIVLEHGFRLAVNVTRDRNYFMSHRGEHFFISESNHALNKLVSSDKKDCTCGMPKDSRLCPEFVVPDAEVVYKEPPVGAYSSLTDASILKLVVCKSPRGAAIKAGIPAAHIPSNYNTLDIYSIYKSLTVSTGHAYSYSGFLPSTIASGSALPNIYNDGSTYFLITKPEDIDAFCEKTTVKDIPPNKKAPSVTSGSTTPTTYTDTDEESYLSSDGESTPEPDVREPVDGAALVNALQGTFGIIPDRIFEYPDTDEESDNSSDEESVSKPNSNESGKANVSADSSKPVDSAALVNALQGTFGIIPDRIFEYPDSDEESDNSSDEESVSKPCSGNESDAEKKPDPVIELPETEKIPPDSDTDNSIAEFLGDGIDDAITATPDPSGNWFTPAFLFVVFKWLLFFAAACIIFEGIHFSTPRLDCVLVATGECKKLHESTTFIHSVIDAWFGPAITRLPYLLLNPFIHYFSDLMFFANLALVIITILVTLTFGIAGDLFLSLFGYYIKRVIVYHTDISTAIAVIVLPFISAWIVPPYRHKSLPGRFEPKGEDYIVNALKTVVMKGKKISVSKYNETMGALISNYNSIPGVDLAALYSKLRGYSPLSQSDNDDNDASTAAAWLDRCLNQQPLAPLVSAKTSKDSDADEKTDNKRSLGKDQKIPPRGDLLKSRSNITSGPEKADAEFMEACADNFRNYNLMDKYSLEEDLRLVHNTLLSTNKIPKYVKSIRGSKHTNLHRLNRIGPNTYVGHKNMFSDKKQPIAAFDPNCKTKAYNSSSNSVVDAVGGLVKIDGVTTEKDEYTYTVISDSPYIMISSDTASFVTLRTLPILQDFFPAFEPKRKFINISGVAACGKTYGIAKSLKPGDIALAETRSSVKELMVFLEEAKDKDLGFVDPSMVHLMTMGSFLMKPKKPRSGTLHIDEACMMHPGAIYFAAEYAQASNIYGHGDPKQLTFISRVAGFKLFSDSVRWNERTVNYISRITPQDSVVMLRNPAIGDYGDKYKTLSEVEKSMSYHTLSSANDRASIPRNGDRYLTWTQDARDDLKNKGFKNVFTVGESQGSRANHVIFVRTEINLGDDLIDDAKQTVVACTRHRTKFSYYVVPSAKEDRISKGMNYIKRFKSISAEHDNPTTGYSDPKEYCNVSGGALKVRNYGVLKFFTTVRHELLSKLQGFFGKSSTTEVVIDDNSDDLKVPDAVFVRDLCAPATTVEEVATLLQEGYNCILPGVADDRRIFDNSVREFSDISIGIDGYARFNPATEKPMKPVTVHIPLINTDMEPPRPPSSRTYLHALGKRNMASYRSRKNTNRGDARRIVEHAVKVYFGPAWRRKLDRIQARKVELTEQTIINFIDSQTEPTIKLILKQHFDVSSLRLDEYDMILKKICKASEDIGAAHEWSQAQVVIYQSKFINAIFGPIMREMFQVFLDNVSDNILINKGKSTEKVEEFIQQWCTTDVFEFIENDFSKYDKTQDDFIILIEKEFYILLGMNPEMAEWWFSGKNFTRSKSHESGFFLFTAFQRKSGDVTTSLGNTIINMIAVAWAYFPKPEAAWLVIVFAMFLGDDSILAVKRGFLTSKILREGPSVLLSVFNLQAKVLVSELGYFCGNYLVRYLGKIKLLSDPLRRVARLGRYDLKTDTNFEELWTSLNDNLRNYDDQGLLDAFCEQVFLRPVKKVGDLNAYRMLTLGLASLRNNKKLFRSLWSMKSTTLSF